MKRAASRFIVSAYWLGILLVFGLPITAQADSNEAIHERMLAGIGQVNFDPSAPESTRTIDGAWIIEAARKHVDINIYGAVIRGPLSMPYFTFEGEVQLGRCTFDGYVNFGFTTFNKTFAAYQSVFRAGASFEEATFNSRAIFGGSKFDGGGAWFQDAHARGVFDASEAIFGGKTGMISGFSRAQFDRGAVFSVARFDTDADFSAAGFGEKTDFLGTQFHGAAIFDRAHFARATSFGDTSNKKLISTFSSSARFNLAQFDSDVWFVGVPFHGDAEFISVRFGGDAFFQGASFQGDARFDRSLIVGSAFFRSESTVPPATFEKSAWFDYAHFESDVFFNGVRFKGPVSFQETASHIVHFSQLHKDSERKEETAEFSCTLDLRGFTYDRIYASWKNLFSKTKVYDRQPYTQLEKVLRSGGEDDQADQVYLARLKAERREVKWKQSKTSWFLDWMWWFAANYGIRSWRLLTPVFFVFLGALIFRLPGAVLHNPRDHDKPQSGGRLTRWDPLRLSLLTLLPFGVPWPTRWIPAHKSVFWKINWRIRYSDFAFLLKMLGWFFVPLWVGVLAGAFRHVPS